jgi:hypothetical protein
MIRMKVFAKISLFKTYTSTQSTTFHPLLAFMMELFFAVLTAYLYYSTFVFSLNEALLFTQKYNK